MAWVKGDRVRPIRSQWTGQPGLVSSVHQASPSVIEYGVSFAGDERSVDAWFLDHELEAATA